MPRNPDKRPCSIPGCRAWAIRDSNPPLCAPHTYGKAGPETDRRFGAPWGNDNALTHGFYASALHPDDLDETAYDESLENEMLILRVALRRLLRMIITGLSPEPNPQPLDVQDYARFFGLTFRGVNTLTRLFRTRQDLPGNDRWEEIMNLALDQLSEEWGIEL